MRKINLSNKKNGFTLIEVLIYSALLAVFLGGSISLLSDILDSSVGVSEKTEILSAQEFIERKLEWVMSSAKRIDEPAANSSSSILRVTLDDTNSTQVIFSQSTTTLEVSWAGGPPVKLTNSRIGITGFSASHISSANSSPQLKISFTASNLTGKNYAASSSFLYVFQR